jgi:D-alanine-D-alanine ligase
VNVTHDQFDDDGLFESVMREIPGRLVVKPNDQGSTVGMTILDEPDVDSLEAAVRLAGAFTSSVMIEAYVPGRELTVAVLGSEALPVIEIVPKQGFYDFENKYVKGNTEYHCPADISDVIDEHVRNLAVAAHSIIGCRAYSRVDFRLTPEGMPFCLEVNTIPGFTATSLVPMAAKQAGIEFPELCMEIIRLSGADRSTV